MKKNFSKLLLTAIVSLFFTGCLSSDDDEKFDVKIDAFVFQSNEGPAIFFTPYFRAINNIYAPITLATITYPNDVFPYPMNKYSDYAYQATYTSTTDITKVNGTYNLYFESNNETDLKVIDITNVGSADILGNITINEFTYSNSEISVVMDSVANAISYGFIITPEIDSEYPQINSQYEPYVTVLNVAEKISYKFTFNSNNTIYETNSFKIQAYAISKNGVILKSTTEKYILKGASSFSE